MGYSPLHHRESRMRDWVTSPDSHTVFSYHMPVCLFSFALKGVQVLSIHDQIIATLPIFPVMLTDKEGAMVHLMDFANVIWLSLWVLNAD